MTTAWKQHLQQWLATRAPRERQALFAMAWVLGLALLWSVGIAPAWRTLKEAPVQQTKLAPQLQTMRAQAAQAQTLKTAKASQPKRDENLRALMAATQRHLGPQTAPQIQGEQATVFLQSVPATSLAAWLEDVRINARLTPTDVRLTRQATVPNKATSTEAKWSGTVVLSGVGLTAP